ncbi:hypothetical protein GCM10023194_07960 [Planotetraspora phitsanulokensis]|uniref:Uncharacterized protein n=1 Tax=Planotetraspora phitsanulokensis TaxID=575192 RepID=A0A8J3U7B7_9ACTN|nr:hypothetical protein [Planotetraspora phitsanulokensis]GII40018.1 hypothetical protein Pph01_50210 [Planotetraspora phitsanulokensis]
MVDPGSDDSMDQNGSFVRPYVSRSGPHGVEGEQYWSEDLDDTADRRSLEDSGGDLLSNEWRRKADRERVGGEDGAAHEALDSGEPRDEWADRGRGEADGDWDGRDHSRGDWDGRDDSRADWDARRDATDEWEATGEWNAADMRGDDPDGRRRPYEDGGAEPSGFLGSGWRDGPRPGEVPESGRKSVLLRAGAVAAVVIGAIWALAAWVGQPSADPCPSGGCTAKPPAASAKATVVPVDDPATSEEADPGDVLTPVTPVTTATPKATPRTTASPSATVTKAPASHKPTATPTAPQTSTPAAPKPTPTPKPTRTTATPTPSQNGGGDDNGGGGLFGWLF